MPPPLRMDIAIGAHHEDERLPGCDKSQHFLGKVSIDDAEAGGKVVDPYHRAPDLLFGHRNPAWRTFLKQKKLGYQLRKFAVSVEEERYKLSRQIAAG